MSSISVRFFMITDDFEILGVSINKLDRLLKSTDEEKIEKFAGKRVRAIYHYFHFNEKGILDKDRLRNDGNIVSIDRNTFPDIEWTEVEK